MRKNDNKKQEKNNATGEYGGKIDQGKRHKWYFDLGYIY